ncbi:hypothetical protein SLA2020_385310 [Shorea laevis]
MASRRSCIFFLLAFVLSVLMPQSSAQNVTLSLYYETLCPSCADFIVNHLVKLFDNGLISIVNLRMVPWGNAQIEPGGTFLCQHGPDECALNTVEACTITIYPDPEKHFRFIHCVEGLALENKLNVWISCFDKAGIAQVPIDCYRNGYGIQIEENYAAETAQLNPPHRFVPWVVVDDQPLEEDYQNFFNHVCKAYRGNQVPEVCQSLPLGNNLLPEENSIGAVIEGKN